MTALSGAKLVIILCTGVTYVRESRWEGKRDSSLSNYFPRVGDDVINTHVPVYVCGSIFHG